MRALLFACLFIASFLAYGQDDEAPVVSQTKMAPARSVSLPHASSGPAPSASSVPSLTPEQAQDILQKVQQGQKLKEDQQKALDELDKDD